MKNPLLKAPLLFNIVVFIVAGYISWFTLIFGFAHLYDGLIQLIAGNSVAIPKGESFIGTMMVLFLCVIGIGALFLAIAALRGIFRRVKY